MAAVSLDPRRKQTKSAATISTKMRTMTIIVSVLLSIPSLLSLLLTAATGAAVAVAVPAGAAVTSCRHSPHKNRHRLGVAKHTAPASLWLRPMQ